MRSGLGRQVEERACVQPIQRNEAADSVQLRSPTGLRDLTL